MRPAVIHFTKKIIIDGKSNDNALNQIVQTTFEDISLQAEDSRARSWKFFEMNYPKYVSKTNEDIGLAVERYIQRLNGELPDTELNVFKVETVSAKVKDFNLQGSIIQIEIEYLSEPFTIIDSIQDTILMVEGHRLQDIKDGNTISGMNIIKYKLSDNLQITSYQA